MFLKIVTIGESGWIVIWGSSQEFMSLIYSYGCKREQPVTYNCVHVEVNRFVMNTWKLLSMKIRERIRSEVSRQCFCRNYQITKGRPCRS